MKGTAPSEAGAEALRSSAKDRAENLMIVDLLRNDISRIGDDVRVSDLFAVQALSAVLQMTSTVTGTARPGTGLPEVFGALFPCGSVTGAPKIAAMQAIAAYETSPRGAYCGALGVIQPGGKAIFSVGIRTVTIAGAKATCGVGSGITWDLNAGKSLPKDVSNSDFFGGQAQASICWRRCGWNPASIGYCSATSIGCGIVLRTLVLFSTKLACGWPWTRLQKITRKGFSASVCWWIGAVR